MSKITFTNSRNESVTISDNKPFLLIDFSTNVDNNIYTTKAPNQDGETFRESDLNMREINIELMVVGDSRESLIRQKSLINRVFNPKLGVGTLKYEDENTIRVIKGQVDSLPFFGGKGAITSSCLISLLSPSPYWRENTVNTVEMISWVGGLQFPLNLPTEFASKGATKININNSGDVDTPIVLEIKGPATNPKITNTSTGDYIKVNRELALGETLTISTEFGNKTVKKDGVNVFNYIDINSVFFNLGLGDNLIELTTDSESDNASVTITYTKKFIGV